MYLDLKIQGSKICCSGKEPIMTTATLIVRHRVNDFGAWRSVYDSVENLRQQHGCTADEVMVDPADKHEVFVVHRFPTVEQAEAFAGSDELREAMGRAGIAGPPRIEIAVGV
jgi:quinol monooxygenase YgiN